MEWQSIETAPKYGEKINLLEGGVEYLDCEWLDGSWCVVYRYHVGPDVVQVVENPTHWRKIDMAAS